MPKQAFDYNPANEEHMSYLLNRYTTEQIEKALAKLNSKSSEANPGNLQPCVHCGGVKFIPTGTCAVCAVCGESQGCS